MSINDDTAIRALLPGSAARRCSIRAESADRVSTRTPVDLLSSAHVAVVGAAAHSIMRRYELTLGAISDVAPCIVVTIPDSQSRISDDIAPCSSSRTGEPSRIRRSEWCTCRPLP